MIAIIETFTLLFSIASAWHDVVPVQKMIKVGATDFEENTFHNSGFIQRGLFTIAVSVSNYGLSIESLVLFVLMALIQYAAFDTTLHWRVKGKPFYVGYTANSDKMLRKLFGEAGGKVKFFACLFVIAWLHILWPWL